MQPEPITSIAETEITASTLLPGLIGIFGLALTSFWLLNKIVRNFKENI